VLVSVYVMAAAAFRPSDLSRVLSPVEDAIADIAAGRMVVVRSEAAGHPALACAAERVTTEAVNFLATEARGLIALALTPSGCDRLGLPPMSRDDGTDRRLPYTVSIEARHGVSTGISAADRAHTLRVASDRRSGPADVVRPGHIFPVRAHARGVVLHDGHAEAAVDLARLAGLEPAGVVCAILDGNGNTPSARYLSAFCARHGLTSIDVSELVRYRLRTEAVLERVMDTSLPTLHGTFRALGYASPFDDRRHIALVTGDVAGAGGVVVESCSRWTLDELLGEPWSPAGAQLHAALERIRAAGAGVLVCVGSATLAVVASHAPAAATLRSAAPGTSAIVAGVLADLEVEAPPP
jgi:3,4-dihydroxy 2-butanone 4-phosphate synthase/GTP cyclohydrolase II